MKTGKLGRRDEKQMGLYLSIFDDRDRFEIDNPTIGVILCTNKDETTAKYVVPNGDRQMFDIKHRSYLPAEEELVAEIERKKHLIEQQLKTTATQ